MKSPVINSMIGLSAALLLAGCASSDYGTTDYTYTETTDTSEPSVITEPSGAQPSPSMRAQDEVVIPLHEEQLNVGKRTIDNEVVIRKVVTSEPVSRSVDLRRETLTIEREPAGAAREPVSTSAQPSGIPGMFEEGAVTIQLQEEQPVVEKTTVKTGEVVARKTATMDTQEVQGEIRREDVRIDRSGDRVDTTIPGYSEEVDVSSPRMNEPAGAQPQPEKLHHPDYD